METKQMYSNVEILGDFPEWLRTQLTDKNMKVARLSKLSGVHPNTIRNYLAGRCEPSYYNVILLVKALGYELGVVKVWY